MKQLLSAILIGLMACGSAFGLATQKTNSVNLVLANVCDGTFNDFKFQLSGYDDQAFVFNYDKSLTGVACTFRITKPMDGTIYLDVPLTSITVGTTNATFSISRTNIPPPGSYYGELLSYESATTNYYRSLAQGKLPVTWSLYLNESNFFARATNTAAIGQVYVHPNWIDPPWLSSTSALGAIYFTIANSVVLSNWTDVINTKATNNLASITALRGYTNYALTAYNWGNHATNGYITNTTETLWSAVSNTITVNAENGATAYTWGNHASAGYLTTVTNIFTVIYSADRSKLNTNISGLTVGIYTGSLTSVSYTGVTTLVIGRTYVWGYTKIGADGTSTLSIASQSLSATAAGTTSNYFTYSLADTNLILKLDGNGLAICNASNVYVRQITNGNINAAGDVNVGGTMYVNGTPMTNAAPHIAETTTAHGGGLTNWIATNTYVKVETDSIATNRIFVTSNAYVAADTALKADVTNRIELASNAFVAADTAVRSELTNMVIVTSNALQNQATALQGATNNLNTRAGSLESATNSLNTRVTANSGATNVLNLATNALQAQATALIGATGMLNTSVGNLNSATNVLQVQAASLQGATGVLNTATNALQSQATAASGATNLLNIATNVLQSQATALANATNLLNGATNNLNTRVAANSTATGLLNSATGALNTAVTTLNGATGVLNTATNSLNASKLSLSGGVMTGGFTNASYIAGNGAGLTNLNMNDIAAGVVASLYTIQQTNIVITGSTDLEAGVAGTYTPNGSHNGLPEWKQNNWYIFYTNGDNYCLATNYDITLIGGKWRSVGTGPVGAYELIEIGVAGIPTGSYSYVVAYGTNATSGYRGDWGASVSGQVALLNTASNLLNLATNAINTVANAALPKAGGTMTGALITPTIQITNSSPTNGAVWIATTTVGQGKWSLPVGFSATMTGNFAFTNSVARTVDVWGNEQYDLGSNFDGTTFTAPVAGVYVFSAKVYVAKVSGATLGNVAISIATNGAPGTSLNIPNPSPVSDETGEGQISRQLKLQSNDLVTMIVQGQSGHTNRILSTSSLSFFEGALLRELP